MKKLFSFVIKDKNKFFVTTQSLIKLQIYRCVLFIFPRPLFYFNAHKSIYYKFNSSFELILLRCFKNGIIFRLFEIQTNWLSMYFQLKRALPKGTKVFSNETKFSLLFRKNKKSLWRTIL